MYSLLSRLPMGIPLKFQIYHTSAVPHCITVSLGSVCITFRQIHTFLQAKDKDSNLHETCANASWHNTGNKCYGGHCSLVTHSDFLDLPEFKVNLPDEKEILTNQSFTRSIWIYLVVHDHSFCLCISKTKKKKKKSR